MPYTADKPPQAISGFPKHAQEIWIAAFNDTYEKYDGNEDLAFSIAWAAVRKGYEQDSDGKWHKISEEDIKGAARISADVHLLAAQGDTGYKWKVQIIESGIDKNNINYPLDVLRASRHLYEGARVFALSEAQHTKESHPYGKSVRDLVGWLSDVSVNATGLEGTFNILASAKWLRDMIVDAWGKGRTDLIGLSHDVFGKEIKRGSVRHIEKIVKVDSVDVVYEPAAGGKFLRMAAAAIQAGQKEEAMWKKLLASLKEQRPDLKAAIAAVEAKGDAATEDEISTLVASAMSVDVDERVKAAVQAAIDERMKVSAADDKGADDSAKKLLDETRVVACSIILKDELKESGLPELSQARLRKQYEGKVFEADALRAAIKDEKEYLDKITGSGAVTGSGDVRVTQTDLESRSKMLDEFFDGKPHSFKAAYIKITGDERITGRVENAQRLRASLTTASFDQILGDSITRKMVKEYATAGLDNWRKIVDVVSVSDFRSQKRVRYGGYGNLPAVAESGAYTALTSPSDEEASYAATKRGGTEDLTVEMIRNDDVGAIRRIPQRLGRAAARTLHEFVFDSIATNPTIYDSVALFHASHANLGSNALDATYLAAGRRAMLKQTEAGSSKRLGIPPRYIVVPLDLDKTAWDLIVAPDAGMYQPTSPDFMKTWKVEMIAVPYWTDTNNWFLVANPADIPTIEVGFMDGNETPELFVQDLPNVGSMFNNDKLTYKIRHIYGGAVIDYRGFYGAIVA